MQTTLWENLLIGLMVIGLIFWFKPGIKTAMQHSQNVEKDWKSVLYPLTVVVLFVMLLIALA